MTYSMQIQKWFKPIFLPFERLEPLEKFFRPSIQNEIETGELSFKLCKQKD